MRRLTWAFLVVLALVGCGIKAPPLPPLDEPTPAPARADAPDGGCCREAKP